MLGGMGDEGCSPWCPSNDNEQCCGSLSGCHVADSNMAPGFDVREMNGGEVSCLTSAHCHLCPFVGAGHCL